MSAPRKSGGQNEPCAHLAIVGISIHHALTNFYAQFPLILPKVVKAVLLSNGPCLTDILGWEWGRCDQALEDEWTGNNGETHMEMHFLTVLIHDEHLDPPPPPQHTYRKGWDAKQAAQWERGGHCTRQDPIHLAGWLHIPESSIMLLIMMPITSKIKVQGNVTLLFWRHSKPQLIAW